MSYDRFVMPSPDLPSMAEIPGGVTKRSFVSRAGHKLEAALVGFGVDVRGKVCADLGANVGGFTDCLLRYGAAKVFAVDTAYGVLAWALRKDRRVVVRERTNALHVVLPEKCGVVVADVGWTRQGKVLPQVATLLADEVNGLGSDGNGGEVLTLVKPHYESEEARVQKGVLTKEQSEAVLWGVLDQVVGEVHREGSVAWKWELKGVVQSPMEGQKGNVEYVAWLRRARV